MALVNPEIVWRSDGAGHRRGGLPQPARAVRRRDAPGGGPGALPRPSRASRGDRGRRPAGPLPAARDRPSRRHPVRRPSVGAAAQHDPAQARQGAARACLAEPRLRGSSSWARPPSSCRAWSALLAAGHDILAVYTQPPRPAGRGHQLRRTPVHEAAERLGLEVRTPAHACATPDAQAAFAALDADLAVVGAYGLLLPKPVLDRPAPGLHQPACLAAAALARCRADRARHPGRRRRDRHHASSRWRRGSIPGLSSRCGRCRSQPTHRGRAARAAGRARRRHAAGRSSRICRRHAAGRAAARGRRHLRAQARARRRAGSTSRSRPRAVERRLRALNPAPGCLVRGRGRAADAARGRGRAGRAARAP